jgi:hypothetical protein
VSVKQKVTAPLYRNGYPLKQEGCFTRIRSDGEDIFANVPHERLAFRYMAKSLSDYGRIIIITFIITIIIIVILFIYLFIHSFIKSGTGQITATNTSQLQINAIRKKTLTAHDSI